MLELYGRAVSQWSGGSERDTEEGEKCKLSHINTFPLELSAFLTPGGGLLQ